MPNTPYQHIVLDYYVERLRQLRAQRRERLDRIRTPAQARAYQREIRRTIQRAMTPRPRKTALAARVTGATEDRHCRVENILLHSRPDCLISANLYLPRKLSDRVPAVLGACGHDAEGKEAAIYQAFCQRLARAGFAVLIYDPFNQGERDQYWRLADKSSVASCTHAHNMMGKQLELNGEFFGMWRAWDGIRALDYLLARPEVDPTHVGLTGNSGGGTLTTWLWPIEQRITMAAPSCFVTTFLANLENELPADAEQYPPGVIGAGLEMADFLIARAPDPVLLLGQTTSSTAAVCGKPTTTSRASTRFSVPRLPTATSLSGHRGTAFHTTTRRPWSSSSPTTPSYPTRPKCDDRPSWDRPPSTQLPRAIPSQRALRRSTS